MEYWSATQCRCNQNFQILQISSQFIQFHKLHKHLLNDHLLFSTRYLYMGNKIHSPGNMALQMVRQVLFSFETTPCWADEPATSTRQVNNHSSVKVEKMTKWLNTACWHGCVVRPFTWFILCIPLCLLEPPMVLTKHNTYTQFVFIMHIQFLNVRVIFFVIQCVWNIYPGHQLLNSENTG